MQASDLTKFRFATAIAGPYCSPCNVAPVDVGTWSQYPARQDVNLNCNSLVDVSGIYLCDTAYIVQDPVGELVISNAGNDISMVADTVTTTRFIQTSTDPYPRTFYVSKAGNDTTGTGSESNPFLTVQRGITEAETLPSSTNPYDYPTIYVDSGIYLEKLTITKNLTIIGINQYLANNIANYGGQHSTRIGDNLGTNFVDIRSAVAGHVVRFENIDFRCRISNMEAGIPANAVNLYMTYCNINRPSEGVPILRIGGVSIGTLSTVYMSNVRANGTCTDLSNAVYEFPETNLNMEGCRWNGTPSAIGIIRTTRAVTIVNCEFRYVATTSPVAITNLPVFVLNFGGGQTARFSNVTISLEYTATKTVGANLITIPSGAPLTSTAVIQFDNCYFLFRNATAANYILRNLSGTNVNLQFHRVSTMTTTGGNGLIDYTNIPVIDPGAIITSTTNVLGAASFSSTFQLPNTLTAAGFSAGVITFNVANNSILAGSVTITGAVTGLSITTPRIGGQYQLFITSSGANTISNVLTGGVKTNYGAAINLANGETAVMTILYDGTTLYVSAARYV